MDVDRTGIDPAGRTLDQVRERIDQLERFAMTALVFACLLPIAVGSLLPWIIDDSDDKTTTYRLITAAFQFYDASPGSSSNDQIFSVIMTISYALLDLVTVATVIMLVAMRGRSWSALRTGNVIVGLGLVCIVGVWLTTLLAAGNSTDSATRTHLTPVVCWSLGIALTAIGYHAAGPRSWWQERPPDRPTVAPVVVSRATPQG